MYIDTKLTKDNENKLSDCNQKKINSIINYALPSKFSYKGFHCTAIYLIKNKVRINNNA